MKKYDIRKKTKKDRRWIITREKYLLIKERYSFISHLISISRPSLIIIHSFRLGNEKRIHKRTKELLTPSAQITLRFRSNLPPPMSEYMQHVLEILFPNVKFLYVKLKIFVYIYLFYLFLFIFHLA